MATIEVFFQSGATVITAPEQAAFALDIMSTVCFAALIVTFISSERLRIARHPVLLNLFATLLLYSGLMMLSGLVRLNWTSQAPRFLCVPASQASDPHCDQISTIVNDVSTAIFVVFQVIAGDVPWMMTQIATLNLIIHVWYTLRSIGYPSPSQRTESRRQVLFLVTPYCFGLLPLIELIPIELAFVVMATTVVEALLITVTSVWDIIIIVSFIRRRRSFEKSRMGHLLSTRLLAKVLVFSVYRLSLTILNLVSVFNGGTPILSIVVLGKSLFPLLVFVFLGLRKDVFELWFPGLFNIRSKASRTLAPRSQRRPSWASEDGIPMVITPRTPGGSRKERNHPMIDLLADS